MIPPDQFNDIESLPSFLVPVEQVLLNGENLGPCDLSISYDHSCRPLISFGDFFAPDLSILECEVSVLYKKDSTPCPIIITKRSYNLERNKPTVEARLTREPLALIDKSHSQKFEAVLLSVPNFFSNPIRLQNESGDKFEIIPFESAEGSNCVVHSDLKLDPNEPLKPLSVFLDFMTFMKGSDCGFGNLFAYDENGEISFRLLGFSRNDSARRKTNWFDIEMQDKLPQIFLMFSKACSDELASKALRQTINFYRASNASRDVSIEMAIIAAHSALEAIVNFILSYRAGWSKSMLTNRTISFSDKNRAASLYLGVQSNLLSRSPALSDYSKKNRDLDVFDIVSQFRNKLVHQDTKTSPTGIQLHEVWLISQWLVEILIFGLIGYRGTIIDRRIYTGWRGTTCEVPIK